MSSSKYTHCHTSARAFSRCPRPTVASIADVFVSSLVLATLCHEHSPRVRQFSTASSRTSEQHLRRYRLKGFTGADQLPNGSTSHPPAQPSRTRSWLSAGLAHSDDVSFQQNCTATTFKKKIRENSDGTPSSLERGAEGSAEETTREQLGEPISDLITRPNRDTAFEGDEHGHAGAKVVDEVGPSDTSTPKKESGFSYDEKNYIAISRLYRRILGDDSDWKAAVDTLMAFPQGKRGMSSERDEIERPSVARFTEVLYSETIPTTQHLFRLYRDIPAPGVAKLSKTSRGSLLRRLADPPNRRWADVRRYLAVVEDMVTAGLHMSPSLWASAIYLAGRGTGSGRVKRRDLVRAVGIWQQMEHLAGVPADAAVFEILFSVAVKAGQYTVAGRLEKEMASRGLVFGRYGMVTKMLYHGLSQDVRGISRTLEKFVKSGEIVDTVVLNCLCASYLRAGETRLAEGLYARMIEAQVALRKKEHHKEDASLHNVSPVEPVLSSEFVLYRANTRKLGRLLKSSPVLKRLQPEFHRVIQDSLPMTPDTRTFYIFLRHHALQTGRFDMFMSVLHDMEDAFAVPPRHMIYMLLFEGFGLHGRRMKDWSAKRLRLVWHSYLRALHESKARLDGLSKGPKSPKTVWENPLKISSVSDGEADVPGSDPDGFYIPLPSDDPQGTPDRLEMQDNVEEFTPDHLPDTAGHEADVEEAPNDISEIEESGHDVTDDQRRIITDAICDDLLDIDIDPDLNHVQYLQRRVEHGVFVGRQMIIVILRAFGACCGPKEVLEVWLQLERLWHADHRKANDVFAVKEELDRQMSKDPPRPDRVG